MGSVSNPTERIIGQYLGRDESERTIRFRGELPFDGDAPGALLMLSSLALLQYVLERVKGNPKLLQILFETARFTIANFGLPEWAGEASREKLPRAALARALGLQAEP